MLAHLVEIQLFLILGFLDASASNTLKAFGTYSEQRKCIQRDISLDLTKGIILSKYFYFPNHLKKFYK